MNSVAIVLSIALAFGLMAFAILYWLVVHAMLVIEYLHLRPNRWISYRNVLTESEASEFVVRLMLRVMVYERDLQCRLEPAFHAGASSEILQEIAAKYPEVIHAVEWDDLENGVEMKIEKFVTDLLLNENKGHELFEFKLVRRSRRRKKLLNWRPVFVPQPAFG